ncbi:MAG: cellobiose phosphorylase [Lachnospiraceae bacterium]|nr:cellobiose phosphorylase [Lachnospiraceae bacterium]
MENTMIKDGDFYIEDYDRKPPFSSFLPGLTGEDGIPMWAFYTNRGQAVASFGVNSKAEAIMEFTPACTEYENVRFKSFRTFVRVNGTNAELFTGKGKRTMAIKKNSLRITEINPELGLEIRVDYFILPKEPIGALCRRVKITNISDKEMDLEALDGAAKIIPRGISNGQFEEMANLFKSWTDVRNTKALAPIFAMRASTDDSAMVSEIRDGYFFASVCDGKLMPFICDPVEVFGYDTSLFAAEGFNNKKFEELKTCKKIYNKVPCAFVPLKKKLAPNQDLYFVSFFGYTRNEDELNAVLKRMASTGKLSRYLNMADDIAFELTLDVHTQTNYPTFDKYIEQCYLDNFLRGGYPTLTGGKVLHLYSRKHGDPERDYNFFTIEAGYYSQGNGNYRDVCQNRRNDVFFCPKVGDFNVRNFMSLMQLDGYNPLEIRPETFTIEEGKMEEALRVIKSACSLTDKRKSYTNELKGFTALFTGKFKPADIFNEIKKEGLELTADPKKLVADLLGISKGHIEAGALEGYWSDHFDYNLDLIENYLLVFPDKEEELLAGEGYPYYENEMRVLKRDESYVLNGSSVRRFENIKREAPENIQEGFNKWGTNWKKDKKGELVTTSLQGKLLTLVLNKFSSMDSYGMGVEMEGGKPGWNDAMNGLPSMFASSMPETFELLRLIKFLRSAKLAGETSLPAEVADYFKKIYSLLKENRALSPLTDETGASAADFAYWDKMSSIREEYRDCVYRPLSGEKAVIAKAEVEGFLSMAEARIESGIERARRITGGFIPTYFTFDVTDYKVIKDENGEEKKDKDGRKFVKALGFKVKSVPLFLEGPARYLSVGVKDAKTVHEALLKTDIYDKKLGMFKTSESLENMSYEYGRIRAFTPGWLERESIFLHMEYKYLAALLVNGLYEEFYKAVKTSFIPFMKAEVYGRSILENSSFIASSANPDKDVVGRGYVARLSGSTTEVLTMWIHMFAGKRPFFTENDELCFCPEPALSGDFFGEDKTASFTFMGQCRLVYHNEEGRNTYGNGGAKVYAMRLLDVNGKETFVESNVLRGEDAEKVRDGGFVRIDAYLR